MIHDCTLERTTDGIGAGRRRARSAELRRLDAGAWFAPAFARRARPDARRGARRRPAAGERRAEAGRRRRPRGARAGGRRGGGGPRPGRLLVVRPAALERLRALLGRGRRSPSCGRTTRSRRRCDCARARRCQSLAPPQGGGDARGASPTAAAAGLAVRVWTVNAPDEFDAARGRRRGRRLHRLSGAILAHRPARVRRVASAVRSRRALRCPDVRLDWDNRFSLMVPPFQRGSDGSRAGAARAGRG